MYFRINEYKLLINNEGVHHFTLLNPERISIYNKENWKYNLEGQGETPTRPTTLPFHNTIHHISQTGPLCFPPQDQHRSVTMTMSSMSCPRRLFPFAKKFTTSIHIWEYLTPLTHRRQISDGVNSIVFNAKLLQLRHPDHPRTRDVHYSPVNNIRCKVFTVEEKFIFTVIITINVI